MLEKIFSLQDPDVFTAHKIWQNPGDLVSKEKEMNEDIMQGEIEEKDIADEDKNSQIILGSGKSQDLSQISKMKYMM